MNAYYFREYEPAILRSIKAHLPFSEGKYQLLKFLQTLAFGFHNSMEINIFFLILQGNGVIYLLNETQEM